MIEKISTGINNKYKRITAFKSGNNYGQRSKIGDFTDSFVDNTIKSTPFMLALTTTWALIDKSVQKIPFKQAFTNNFKNFFIPVTLISSLFIAGISMTKYKNNNEKV